MGVKFGGEKMNQSIHKTIHSIFLENPDKIFTSRDLVNISNNQYNLNTKTEIITMILIRLHRTGLIHRTPTQLANGYYYSLKNKQQLNSIYENHLLPYHFENKKELITQIIKSNFKKLQNDCSLDFNRLQDLVFVKKYSSTFFKEDKTQQFLALLVGFSMCDGSINRRSNKVRFFFRRKSDAELFIEYFKSIFHLENLKIKPANIGNSFVVEILQGSQAVKFLHVLGAPKGNKVFQSFLVPDWIYHGLDEIKRIFLSTVIGNEGSAPSNNRWRIQFVLSKSKEHVPNLIKFLNQIRAMLYHFGISTLHIQLRKQKGRQFYGRFYIKGKENLRKFYKQFSFLYASEKQEVLEDLISRNISKSGMCNDVSEHLMIPSGR